MKLIITATMAIMFLSDSWSEDGTVTAYYGSKILALEMQLPRHWSLGLFSYSGNLVPSVRRVDEPHEEEYGVQIGAHWTYRGRARLSLEIPYAVGRVVPSGAGSGQHVDEVAATGEPHMASVLTISLSF